MKIREKLNNLDWNDPIENLVALAYLAGQEKATKEICDIHNSRIAAMRKAANDCRYHNLAHSIIDAWKDGKRIDDMIYSGNYAGDVTNELCDDEWPIPVKET
jgi:hypothetical protein